jgi:hypothetical protein
VGAPFSKERGHEARPEKCRRAVEHGEEITAFRQEFPQADGRIVRIRENAFSMIAPLRPPARSILMKCWRNRNVVSPVRIGKFCCSSLRSLPPKAGFAITVSKRSSPACPRGFRLAISAVPGGRQFTKLPVRYFIDSRISPSYAISVGSPAAAKARLIA